MKNTVHLHLIGFSFKFTERHEEKGKSIALDSYGDYRGDAACNHRLVVAGHDCQIRGKAKQKRVIIE